MTPSTRIIINIALAIAALRAKDQLDRASRKFWATNEADRDRADCGEYGLTCRHLLDTARVHADNVAAAIKEIEALS